MEIGELHNKVNDPQFAELLDNILDAVLALKARLADSNIDSNSIGGTNISISVFATVVLRWVAILPIDRVYSIVTIPES